MTPSSRSEGCWESAGDVSSRATVASATTTDRRKTPDVEGRETIIVVRVSVETGEVLLRFPR